MKTPLLLLLAVAPALAQDQENAVLTGLPWLSRHQLPNGGWGGPTPSCRCPDMPLPAPPAKDPAIAAKAAPLLAKLGAESPVEREEAGEALMALGDGVIPELAAAGASEDPEVRARAAELVDRLLRRHATGRVEDSALALLAFLGAGYSHLSKDVIGGKSTGETIKDGLKYLMARQDAEGRIGEGRERVLAALALAEAYGLTGSNVLKEPAQRAVAAALAVEGDDAATTAWRALVLRSAEISDLAVKEGSKERLLAQLEKLEGREGAAAELLLGRVLLLRAKADPGLALVAERVERERAESPERGFFAALALYTFDGPDGPRWKARAARIFAEVPKAQRVAKGTCAHGSWGPATPLRVLTLEVLYRYASIAK